MKFLKLMIAGKVYSTKAGAAQIQIDAQSELDSLFGTGNTSIHVIAMPDKAWRIKVDRTYPDTEQYEVPSTSWPDNETEIYYRDAFIMAGNQGKKVIDFGPMPFVSCGYRYYLAESDFKYYWNAAAKDLGYSKVKNIEFVNDPHYFEVIMKF